MNILDKPWNDIRVAVCSGIPVREVAEHYKVKQDTIRKRIKRESWPVPSIVQSKVEDIRSQLGIKSTNANSLQVVSNGQLEPVLSNDVANALQLEPSLQGLMIQSWLQKGELHKALMFELATQALKSASKKAKKVMDWQDIERADKAARRAAGLDSGDETRVNVNLQLVNARIAAMQDAD